MASQPSPPRLLLNAQLVQEAIGAIVATVGAGRRGGGAAVGETLVTLADVGRRLQLDLAEQEFLAALGPAPAKGVALVGAGSDSTS